MSKENVLHVTLSESIIQFGGPEQWWTTYNVCTFGLHLAGMHDALRKYFKGDLIAS